MKNPVRRRLVAALPLSARRYLSAVRVRRRLRRLGRMSRADAFDEIYTSGGWADNSEGPSGTGSYGPFADHFVEFVSNLIADHAVVSVLDIGTGDFHIGRQLCSKVDRYVAADVSQVVLDRNRSLFGHLREVDFIQLDACVDPLPAADLVLVRQVLQHLSNFEVEELLRNVEGSSCRLALIVEHHPAPQGLIAPNLDLPAHGPLVRTRWHSGVFLEEPPFSRTNASRVAEIPYGNGERLTYYLLVNQNPAAQP